MDLRFRGSRFTSRVWLEKYPLIVLDNFRAILQNRDISNKLEAWLVFLSVDEQAKLPGIKQ